MIKRFGLYAYDIALRTRKDYISCLRGGASEQSALNRMLEFGCGLSDAERDIFLIALADNMFDRGTLTDDVRDSAIKALSLTDNLKPQTADRLRLKLSGPVPERRGFKPERRVPRDPWETGDVYALRTAGGFIAIQKLRGGEFMTCAVFDGIYDHKPELDELRSVRFVPMDSPERVGELAVAFLMKIATASEYPDDRLVRLGSLECPEFHVKPGVEMTWRRVELLAPEYIAQWKGERYGTDDMGISRYICPIPDFL